MKVERVVFSKRFNSRSQWWLIDWYFTDQEPLNEVHTRPERPQAVKETFVRLGWVESYDDIFQRYTLTPPLDATSLEGADTVDAAGEV